jgi:hypothetical protein
MCNGEVYFSCACFLSRSTYGGSVKFSVGIWNRYVRSILEEKSTRRRCEDNIKMHTTLGVCGLDSCGSRWLWMIYFRKYVNEPLSVGKVVVYGAWPLYFYEFVENVSVP